MRSVAAAGDALRKPVQSEEAAGADQAAERRRDAGPFQQPAGALSDVRGDIRDIGLHAVQMLRAGGEAGGEPVLPARRGLDVRRDRQHCSALGLRRRHATLAYVGEFAGELLGVIRDPAGLPLDRAHRRLPLRAEIADILLMLSKGVQELLELGILYFDSVYRAERHDFTSATGISGSAGPMRL